MTHSAMHSCRFRFAVLALVALLVLAGLTGCGTLHGWTQVGTNHPATAGGSISIPLGK